MRKILYLLMLTALFVSCSSDDDTDPNNGNGNNNGMIDEKIIGKWKVEYSKTIKPAVYILNETDLKEKKELYPNLDLKIGLNYPDNATLREYDGALTSEIKSYMFSDSERAIEITNDNLLKIYWFNTSGGLVDAKKDGTYKIEEVFLKYQTAKDNPMAIIKYQLENGILTMELINVEKSISPFQEYRISKYSKISE